MPWKLLLAAATLAALPAVAKTDCHATSSPQTDRWLSSLNLRPEAAVALSLHVDYWDRLGCKNRFASMAFTDRQYDDAAPGRRIRVHAAGADAEARLWALGHRHSPKIR